MSDSTSGLSLVGGGGGGGDEDSRLSEAWVECEVVANATGLSPKTIYRLARICPGFPVIMVGSRGKRFIIRDVKRFILEHPTALVEAEARLALSKPARSRKPKKGEGEGIQ